LLRSPANASRLLESIAALERGQGARRDLVDVDEEPVAALEAEPAQGEPPTRRMAKKATNKAARGGPTVAPGTAKGAAKAPKPSRG
jgi:hypothetical protein